jgi:hypothetical protein
MELTASSDGTLKDLACAQAGEAQATAKNAAPQASKALLAKPFILLPGDGCVLYARAFLFIAASPHGLLQVVESRTPANTSAISTSY